MDRLIQRGPTVGTGAAQAVAVYKVPGMDVLSLLITATTTALTACTIKGRLAPGSDQIALATSATDYTNPPAGSYILRADKSPVTLAGGAVAAVVINVSQLVEVSVETTQLNTGTSTVDAWVREYTVQPR